MKQRWQTCRKSSQNYTSHWKKYWHVFSHECKCFAADHNSSEFLLGGPPRTVLHNSYLHLYDAAAGLSPQHSMDLNDKGPVERHIRDQNRTNDSETGFSPRCLPKSRCVTNQPPVFLQINLGNEGSFQPTYTILSLFIPRWFEDWFPIPERLLRSLFSDAVPWIELWTAKIFLLSRRTVKVSQRFFCIPDVLISWASFKRAKLHPVILTHPGRNCN